MSVVTEEMVRRASDVLSDMCAPQEGIHEPWRVVAQRVLEAALPAALTEADVRRIVREELDVQRVMTPEVMGLVHQFVAQRRKTRTKDGVTFTSFGGKPFDLSRYIAQVTRREAFALRDRPGAEGPTAPPAHSERKSGRSEAGPQDHRGQPDE